MQKGAGRLMRREATANEAGSSPAFEKYVMENGSSETTYEELQREDPTNDAFYEEEERVEMHAMADDVSDMSDTSRVEVLIGSSDISEKCIRTHRPVVCSPDAGDKNIRADFMDHEEEEFDISVSGEFIVCAHRKDRNAGWTTNLAINCHAGTIETVNLGTSDEPTKCIDVPSALSCTWNAANSGIRPAADLFATAESQDGSFYVDTMKADGNDAGVSTRVCVTRLDVPDTSPDTELPGGWKFPLSINCATLNQRFEYEARHVLIDAVPGAAFKCTNLPDATDLVSCAANAANETDFEVVTDYARQGDTGQKPSGTKLCVRNLDITRPWKDVVKLRCNGVGKITIGESLTVVKCITLDQPVTCFAGAGDKGFRLNTAMAEEDYSTFSVMTSGNKVCVRRTDHDGGWQQDLSIACTPKAGVESNAAEGKGAELLKRGSGSSRRREIWLKGRNPWSRNLMSTDPIDANVLRDGQAILLKHSVHRWFGCPSYDDCSSSPSQAPEHYRIFTAGSSAGEPLRNGAFVYIMSAKNTLWLRCNPKCELGPSNCVRRMTDAGYLVYDNCREEQFQILGSSKPNSFIRDGEQIWLKANSNSMFLRCDQASDACGAVGSCGEDATMRQFLMGGSAACSNERFKVLGVRADVRGQAVSVNLGFHTDKLRKCVDVKDADLTCANNAGDPGIREPLPADAADEDADADQAATFMISTKGFVRGVRFTSICAQRTDQAAGWRFPLVITCNRRWAGNMWPHDVPPSQQPEAAEEELEPLVVLNQAQGAEETMETIPSENDFEYHETLMKARLCNTLSAASEEGCHQVCGKVETFTTLGTCASAVAAELHPYSSYCLDFSECKDLCEGTKNLRAAKTCLVGILSSIGGVPEKMTKAHGPPQKSPAAKKMLLKERMPQYSTVGKSLEARFGQDESSPTDPTDTTKWTAISDESDSVAPVTIAKKTPKKAQYAGPLEPNAHQFCWQLHKECKEFFMFGMDLYSGCIPTSSSGMSHAWCSRQATLLTWPANVDNSTVVERCQQVPCQTVAHEKTKVELPARFAAAQEAQLQTAARGMQPRNKAPAPEKMGTPQRHAASPRAKTPPNVHSGQAKVITAGLLDTTQEGPFAKAPPDMRFWRTSSQAAEFPIAHTSQQMAFSPYAMAKQPEDLHSASLGALESSVSHSNSTEAGDPRCPCVGLDAVGFLQAKDGTQYKFPTGSSCKAWHRMTHPNCNGDGEKGQFCEQSWCFVDPCNCNLPQAYRKARIFDGRYQGKALAYSYVTCGSEDHFEEYNQVTGGGSTTVGSAKLIGARSESDEIECASEVTSAATIGMSNCKCIGLDVPGQISVVAHGSTLTLPANVGSHCAAWDLKHPQCAEASPPEWCKGNWCFVDPCSCSIPIPPQTAHMVQRLRFGPDGRPAYYSSATCQVQNAKIWNETNIENSGDCLTRISYRARICQIAPGTKQLVTALISSCTECAVKRSLP
jgi:hypothetical protein